MLQLNQSQVAIHFCTFQAYLEKAKVNLRFPSLFFVEWKTINGKNSVGMVGRRRATNSLIELNETLTFNTEMLYHRAQKQYLKKESLFHLNLISNSRPDQVKLVGRVVIDLSEIVNSNKYSQITTSKLMYCSVDADISFSLRLTRSIESNLELNDLDRSSFSDLYSFTSPIRNVAKNKMEIKEGFSDRRMEEERRKNKYKLSDREEIGYNPIRNSRKEAKTENILIEESQERSVPQSLPLTEKKPALNMLQEVKMEVKQAEQVKNVVDTGFQARIYQEKDILQKELNDHKNKIKKLEVDIKEAMKLFQQSEQNSELNKSKLAESEEAINSLKANEAKLRQFYQNEVEKTKELGSRQLQLQRSGFEADRKILLATIEELKFKAQDLEGMQKTAEDNKLLQIQNSQLLTKLRNEQELVEELERLKAQNMKFNEGRLNSIEQLKQKDNERLNLAQQNNEIKASNETILAQFNELKLELNNKITELQTIKEESIKTKQFLTIQPTKQALPSVSYLDPDQLENYQRLQEEHKKLTLQLQTLKKSILFPEEYKKTQKENVDLFVIIEKSQLQDIEISELKQENATMREKMEQLVLEHEQLKTQRSGNQSKYNTELETEQFNLLKEEFMLIKEENQKYVENQQILKEEIKDLKQKLSSKSSQLETLELLKMQLLDTQKQNLRLNNELENLKKTEHSAQKDAIFTLKPVKCLVSQEKESIGLQGHHEAEPVLIDIEQEGVNNHHHQISNQASPAKYNTDSKSLGLLEEHHDHEHHDFNFQEHASPLTHEDLNKILEVKEVNRDEMQYLMDEIFKLKEEIEQLKNAKCYRKSQSDLGQEPNSLPFDELNKLQDSLKRMQQENESLKGQIRTLQQKQSNLISQQQHKETISASNEALTEQMQQLQKQSQDHQKTILDQEYHLQQLQKRNQELEGKLKSPHDPFERQNNFIRQLQAKIANLEEQIKIKDDLLAEGERNIEENYTIKYQLADLKDKFSEIKSALQEKEEVINYLQEAKEQLSKELEQAGEKEHSKFLIEPREILIETPKNEVDFSSLEGENADLRNEIQALKKQLVLMNNNQIELRNSSEAAANQKSSAEREKEEHVRKFQEAMTKMNQLEAQVNELSFMINGLNLQLEKSKEEVNCLNDEVNTRSLKNDEITLQVEDLRSKNEELNSKIKIVQSQSAFISAQPLPEPIINNEIDSLKAKYAEKQEEARQKEERLTQVGSELEAARKKVEELTAENQSLLQRIENEGKGEIPFVAVHEVGSVIEPAPVQYEKSIIPLYQREELQRIEQDLTNQKNQDQSQLKYQLQEAKKKLEKEATQKKSYYNALQIANTKIIELQIEAMTLKEQIEKFTSLPIQSFKHMATPVKQQQPQYRHAEASAKSIREPSIVYQPRVKGEISQLSAIINPPEKEAPLQSPQKNAFSKNIETRVDTNVVNEQQADEIKKQLQILKQQLESEQKLHNQLREIHNICEKKYSLLNNHYENCLEQLNNFKSENGGLTTEKENLDNQLYFVKDAYMTLQNEHDALLAIHNKLTQETQNKANNEVTSSQPEGSSFKVNSEQLIEQRRQYQQRLQTAVKNEEKLTHKIQHLQENILNLEKSLQDHIQFSQSNDKITEKLQQLNELQTIAAQFKQEIEQAKQEKELFGIIQAENEQLKKEVGQMLKIVDQHRNCSSQKAEWQAKLLNIEHMLSDSQNRYAGERQELENKLFALAEEKASLIAEKSAIQQNIKQGNQIVISHEDIPAGEAQLHSEMQDLRNQKLNQMQRVADLQEKLNNEQQSRSKRQADLQETVIVREQQVEQLKFINTQLHQQLQESKILASQHQRCTHEVQSLQSKIEEQANLTGQYEMLIHNLREQVNDLSNKNDNNGELERIRTELSILQEEISQKILLIEEQQQKIVQLEQQQENYKAQIANLKDQSVKNQQEIHNNIEASNKLRDENKELLTLKAKIENELKAINARYSQLENAIKNTNKLTDARDKSLEAIKNEVSKKQQQNSDLNKKMKSKEAEILNLTKQLDSLRSRNQEYEAKIRQLAEKEKLMKETMQIVERQSIKIVQSLKSRYQSQEIYYRQCLEKEKENNRLALAVVQIRQQLENKQRVLLYEEEKINQLTNQIEFLKKKGQNDPQANSNAVTVEYKKYEKLMEKNEQLLSKNRQYLEIISNKSASTLENEKLKRQVKEILQKMTEYQQNSIENQRKLDQTVPELEKQLLAVSALKNELVDKVEALQKELQQAKQVNMKNTHTYIENIIMEKDKQISSLKNGSKKAKDSDIFESNDDNISILNEQILNLNRQILEKDNQLNKLKIEIQISKPLTASDNVQLDEEKEKLINELHQRQRRQEQYKESIRKLMQQLKSGLASPKLNDLSPSNESHVQQINTISNELHHLCQVIKQLSLKRSSPEQSDKLFHALIQKYDQMQQQFGSLSNETSVIQQKAKFISKQLQKIKSFVIKSQNRSFKEKTELLALIKPCQNAASQMVNISQTLSDKESQNFI